jgi:hypothetical protein
MRGNYEELPCPFCDKGKIQAWFYTNQVIKKHVQVEFLLVVKLLLKGYQKKWI